LKLILLAEYSNMLIALLVILLNVKSCSFQVKQEQERLTTPEGDRYVNWHRKIGIMVVCIKGVAEGEDGWGVSPQI